MLHFLSCLDHINATPYIFNLTGGQSWSAVANHPPSHSSMAPTTTTRISIRSKVCVSNEVMMVPIRSIHPVAYFRLLTLDLTCK